MKMLCWLSYSRDFRKICTATTESRAATERISAQETTPGQMVSSWDLIVSITSKPLNEFVFGAAVFSPVKFDVSSTRTDPSHPCMHQIHIIMKHQKTYHPCKALIWSKPISDFYLLVVSNSGKTMTLYLWN